MADNILTITTADQTPLVKALLEKLRQTDDLVERLYTVIASQKEEIKFLRDEIAVLKKHSKRPKIKPNKKPKGPGNQSGLESKRPGSEKKAKSLEIHETKVITPENLPEGSTLRRKRSFDIQDLKLKIHNTRYILEEWEAPCGQMFLAQMPTGVAQGHFGNELCSFILNQHHQCQVTQPLLHEQLIEFGIDISTGQLNNILVENKELFHEEKLGILQSGLKVSSYIQVDDTGARHDGKTGYCTQVGNEFFAWFQSTNSKSRVNFLEILNSAYPDAGYLLNEDAFKYMQQVGLPSRSYEILKNSITKKFCSQVDWLTWLQSNRITNKNHIKIATEAALLAGALAEGLNKELIILSDDAGQFNIPTLLHALCWIHAERHIKKLVPITEAMREEQTKTLDDFWALYKLLKAYKDAPDVKLASKILTNFDELFQRKTISGSLSLVLKKIFSQKSELLVVLDHPEIPLHNNGSETDIREYVKRRNVSGGTRSTSGQKCRDTFASLKKTCRKLGVSFYAFLKDRLAGAYEIPKLGILIENAAENSRDQRPFLNGAAA
jgi:hypothetical protein